MLLVCCTFWVANMCLAGYLTYVHGMWASKTNTPLIADVELT